MVHTVARECVAVARIAVVGRWPIAHGPRHSPIRREREAAVPARDVEDPDRLVSSP